MFTRMFPLTAPHCTINFKILWFQILHTAPVTAVAFEKHLLLAWTIYLPQC